MQPIRDELQLRPSVGRDPHQLKSILNNHPREVADIAEGVCRGRSKRAIRIYGVGTGGRDTGRDCTVEAFRARSRKISLAVAGDQEKRSPVSLRLLAQRRERVGSCNRRQATRLHGIGC
jgi:hypothetical protein